MELERNIQLADQAFIRNLNLSDSSAVLNYMGGNLANLGFVSPMYSGALIEREVVYPTGLPVSSPVVAIPHADYHLVNKTTLSVATLVHPVIFRDMGDLKHELPVEIVIMMAISEPHSQVEMLQKLMGMITDDNFRQRLLITKSNKDLKKIFTNKLFEN